VDDAYKKHFKKFLPDDCEGCIVKNNMQTMSGLCQKVERIEFFGPIFTLGTSNSACSVAFNDRISGIRANPLKYTDPDGKHDEVSIFISFRSMPLGIIGNYRAADTHGNISKGIFFANQMSDIITTYSQGISLGSNGREIAGVVLTAFTDLNDAIKGTIVPAYNPDILRRNLIRQGEHPNRGDEAHHIVPGTDSGAAISRTILNKHGIDINHAENGIFLSRDEHKKTFSPDYINRISELLRDADTVGTQSTVLETLQYIKTNLKNSNFNF
jgi:hypothetical protein